MNNSQAKTGTENRSRKLLIKGITLVFPLVLLLLIEGALRLFSYGDNLSLITAVPRTGYEQYLMVNPVVGKKYFQHFESDEVADDENHVIQDAVDEIEELVNQGVNFVILDDLNMTVKSGVVDEFCKSI